MINNGAMFKTNTKELYKNDNAEVIDIGKCVIANIRSLVELLENEHISHETKHEINKTIQEYLKEARKIHVLLPF